MTEAQQALLLATKNRALTRCWLSHTSYGQIAAATAGLLWPIGTVVAGPWGIVAMGGFAGAILVGSVMGASKEADAIELEVSQGGFTKMGEYLTQDDVLDLKRKAIAAGVVSAKKTSPEMGQSQTSGNGTNTTNAGNAASLPRAVARLDEAAPHLFMVGRTREGKSETLKHLIGAEKRVWYVTSKATDKVPSHWQGYRVGGPDLGAQMTWLLDQWEASLLNHLEGADKGREWFVIDEAVGILQSLKTKGFKEVSDRLRGFIVELLTAGAAVNAFGGILSQTGNAGPLGVDEDLLKNFSIVGCGKRKKAQMVKAFCKLTDLRLTGEQETEILSLPGYWQLWESNGPTLSQVPLSTLPFKDVLKCSVADNCQDDRDTQQQDIKPPKASFEDRIIDFLRKQTEGKTARDICRACTRSTDEPRPSVGQIKDMLTLMISEGYVSRETDGQVERYRATGTR
ncbi:MAG: hypothetical protein AAF329_08755 [Cyanobacteria bacterium P01_A01_bin.17]